MVSREGVRGLPGMGGRAKGVVNENVCHVNTGPKVPSNKLKS